MHSFGVMVCGCCDLCAERRKKKVFTLKSFYEWAEGPKPLERVNTFTFWLIKMIKENGWRKGNVTQEQDVTCAICGRGSVVWDASVCLYVSVRLFWCTWGAESTSEWESTVQGAALLLTKGRPFCFILLMYTMRLNVDITEWGMYSNE